MIKPRLPRLGQAVAIVAPSGPIGDLDLTPATAVLERMGFRAKIAPHLHDRWRYLAGTDADRAADLQAAFDDPEVDAVLCARGGYGCARLLPLLDLDRIVAARKPFLGFSDITVLHLALNRRGLATVHSPMAAYLGRFTEGWATEAFARVMRGDASTPEGTPSGETLVGGRAEGLVVGGCLSLLGDSMGTPEALDAEGKIVLIEDIGEKPYRVDARLTHLINAGVLPQAAGIVVGEMTGTEDDREGEYGWRDIVRERLEPLGIPTIVGYRFGHVPNSLALPLGIRATLNADEGTLTYLESFCET